MVSCGGEAPPPPKPSEGRLEKMKPKQGDSLSKLMERDWNNVEYILYGFINYDTSKVNTATENLPELSSYILRGIPQAYRENKAEWQAARSNINTSAVNLKQVFKEQDFNEARNNFRELTKSCMECHRDYRKYLKPKQNLSEAQLAAIKPHDADSLSMVMDRDWDNLKYMLYGFLNYDNVRLKTTTDNLIALADHMAKKITPDHMAHIAEWSKQCNRQRELAITIWHEFEQENFEESHKQVMNLIENCMECHKTYRKHLLLSEEG
jgi:cytochrome c556